MLNYRLNTLANAMKIKLTALSLLLFTSWVSAQEGVQDAKVLETPYQGNVVSVASTSGENNRRETPVTLNYFIPPEKGAESSTERVPRLATTRDGETFTNVHVYRSSLPTEKEIAALESYEDYVRVLGPPTEPAGASRTVGQSSFDTVVWKFFTPGEGSNVTVTHITLERKWKVSSNEEETPEYEIVGYTLGAGGFSPGPGIGPSFISPGLLLQRTPVVSPT